MNAREKGRIGEETAAEYLRNKGWRILERNYQIRRGEIDIIALEGDNLVFIEVKAWSTMKSDSLEYGIDRRKRRKIITVSKDYLMKNRLMEFDSIRYDVILIGNKGVIIEHYKDAFTETGEL